MIDDDEPWKETDIDGLVDQYSNTDFDRSGTGTSESNQPSLSKIIEQIDWGALITGVATFAGIAIAVDEILRSEPESSKKPSRLARAASKLDDKQYNVFISHSWEYDDHYRGIEDLLDRVPSLEWQNHSVPQSKELDTSTDEELKRELRKRMRNASVVLTSAGMYTSDAHSKWIPIEHDIAEDLGKPVVAIRPEGQERIPTDIKDAADELVGWDRASVVDAIAEYA